MWYDNYHHYISGVDLHNRDKSLNLTAIAVLHTTKLPQYLGLPNLDAVTQPGAVVPLKAKLRHMEKTIVGLMLATVAINARLDSTTDIYSWTIMGSCVMCKGLV